MSFAALSVLLVLSAWLQAASDAPPTPEALEAAIGQLGAADFSARQAATDLLWRAGPAAEASLQSAARSTDPEIRARATALLTRLRLGIRPDTPAEVAGLIDQFRFAASATSRRQALAELQSRGHWQAILTLIRGERDAAARLNLASAVAPEAGKLIRPLIERGDLAEAEQVLELVAISEPGVSQLTAFLVLTGRLDAALARAKAQAAAAPSAESWARLAYLERAHGDVQAASAAAAKTSDLFLQANLHAEARQWDQAAGIANELFRRNPTRLETAAFAATFYRLAGNAAEKQRTIDALLKAANVERFQENPPPNKPADPFGAPSSNVGRDYAWTAAETLIVNGRIADALAILRKTNPRMAHALLRRQHRHGESLQFAGIAPDQALDRSWFDKLPAPLGDSTAQQEERFFLAMQVARQLRELGRNEQLAQVLETLNALAAPTNDRGRRLAILATLNWQLGRFDDFPRAAAQAIAAGSPHPTLFSTLLKQQHGALAAFWFDLWLSSDPRADREKLFAKAVWLVAPQPPAGRLPADWRQLVVTAEAAIQKLPDPGKGQRLAALGQTCEIRGERAWAQKYYLQAAELAPSTATRAGDLALSDQDWKAAAEAYQRAAKATDGEAVATYLHGYCLTKAGQTEAGQTQIRLATFTALASEARLKLAEGLLERGLKREAIEQLQLVRRTALPDSPPAASAGLRIGSLTSTSQPGQAADAWEQLLLNQLNSNNFEVEGYLTVGHIIHKNRAIAAARSGDASVVAAELEACERLLPCDVQLIVDLVPKLNQAGFTALADKIVADGLAAHERVLAEFPASATYLNNAAWVCARTQRQLDRALDLAERATALAPDDASYQDTLAEVHFQLGNRDAAIAAARRAAELAPHNPLFATRLKHFQEDQVRTLDAGEME
jgi:hypothetical protein